MNKEFVPYEQALALKELGFDGDCFAIWSGFDEINFSVTDTPRLYSSEFRINGSQSCKFYVNDFKSISLRVSAPTYSQAFRWFRDKGFEIDFNTHRYTSRKFYTASIFDGDKTSYGLKELSFEKLELECLKKLIEIIKEK